MRKAPALILLLLAGVLASVCGGAAETPAAAELGFHIDPLGRNEIYFSDPSGSRTHLAESLPWDSFPAWSPDGSRIAFYSARDGDRDIYVAQADGSEVVNLSNNPAEDAFPNWSPD